ncbi:unnamed protein product [Caenorhabditis brenneri]
MRVLIFFLLLVIGGSASSSTVYRKCGSDINNLWLDIVLVIDNTKILQMDEVYPTIQSMFGASVRIGTGYQDPRSTRVAIVTYNEKAEVVADFNKFKSLKQLNDELEMLNGTEKSDSFSAYMDF